MLCYTFICIENIMLTDRQLLINSRIYGNTGQEVSRLEVNVSLYRSIENFI